MGNHEQFEEQIWDLVYGLLSEEETQQICERITSDPDAARSYSRIKLQAEKIGQAARLTEISVDLERPQESIEMPLANLVAQYGYTRWESVVVVAAAMLLLVAGGWWYTPQSPLQIQTFHDQVAQLHRDYTHVVITAPAEMPVKGDVPIDFQTASLSGVAKSAKFRYELYDEKDVLVDSKDLETDDEGRHQIRLGGDKLALSRTVKVLVENSEPTVLDLARASARKMSGKKSNATVASALEIAERSELRGSVDSIEKSLASRGDRLRADMGSDEKKIAQLAVRRFIGKFGGGSQGGGGGGASASDLSDGDTDDYPNAQGGHGGFGGPKTPLAPEAGEAEHLEVEFDRLYYRPGDRVVASVRRQPKGRKETVVGARVVVDGRVVYEELNENAEAKDRIEFNLEKGLRRGKGALAIATTVNGVSVAAAKEIPIRSDHIDLFVYPEGGQLASGVMNRVFVEAIDGFGNRIGMTGAIKSSKGQQVAEFSTDRNGRGSFYLSPQDGEAYTADWKIDKHNSGSTKIELHPSEAKMAMVFESSVVEAGEPARFEIRAKEELPLVFSATSEGSSVAHKSLIVAAESSESITLELSDEAEGIVQVTVFDGSTNPPTPVAERLLYRRPAGELKLQVTPDRERYMPTEEGVISVNVQDTSGRKTATSLVSFLVPSHVVARFGNSQELSNFVNLKRQFQNVENDLLLASLGDDTASEESLELLLGIEGWRSFEQTSHSRFAQSLAAQSQVTRSTVTNGSFAKSAATRGLGITNIVVPNDLPQLKDNGDQVVESYASSLVGLRDAHNLQVARIGQAVFWISAALMLGLLITSLIGIEIRWRAFGPALATMMACLIVGGIWSSSKLTVDPVVNLNAFAARNRTPLQVASFRVDRESRRAKALEEDKLNDQYLMAKKAELKQPRSNNTGGELLRGILAIENRTEEVRTASERTERIELGEYRELQRNSLGLTDLRSTDSISAADESKLHENNSEGGPPADPSLRFVAPPVEKSYGLLVVAKSGGKVAAAIQPISVRAPFNVSTQLPSSLIVGDEIDVPVRVTNKTDEPLQVELNVGADEGLLVASQETRIIAVPPRATVEELFSIKAAAAKPSFVRMSAIAQQYAERMATPVDVAWPGAPIIEQALSRPDNDHRLVFSLDRPVEGSVRIALRNNEGKRSGTSKEDAFRLTSRDRRAGLKGGFYQRNNESDSERDDDVAERAKTLADSRKTEQGWLNLPTNSRHGFSKSGVARELVQRLEELKKLKKGVSQKIVDEADQKTTSDKHKEGQLALPVTGLDDISRALDGTDQAEKQRMLKELSRHQSGDGSVRLGDYTELEATRLASKAFGRVPQFQEQADLADRWLRKERERQAPPSAEIEANVRSKDEGESAPKLDDKSKSDGEVEITIKQGKQISKTRVALDALNVTSVGQLEKLKEAAEVTLDIADSEKSPLLVILKYHAQKLPATDSQCPLRVTTNVSPAELQHKATGRVNVSVENHSDQAVEDAIAHISLPSGVVVRKKSLQFLQEMGIISSYRIYERSVLLHWNQIEAKRTGERQLNILFEVQGEFRGSFSSAPSSVFLDADSNTKNWAPGFKLNVVE
jgi:hypothetical protein